MGGWTGICGRDAALGALGHKGGLRRPAAGQESGRGGRANGRARGRRRGAAAKEAARHLPGGLSDRFLFRYALGPASTMLLGMWVYFWKFLTKRAARSLAVFSYSASSFHILRGLSTSSGTPGQEVGTLTLK